MGGRGGPKLKEYRVHVTSVRQWLKELEFDGVIVTEVYGNAFGSCQVILPSINSIMLAIDDAESKIKWLTINVGKLEEEQKHAMAEEEKKKQEIESVMRRRSMVGESIGIPNGNTSSDVKDDSVSVSTDSAFNLDDYAAPISTRGPATATAASADDRLAFLRWDRVTIPKLEKFSGYDHPRPMWLFIKDGNIQYELNSANPPKMHKLVLATLNGVKLTEKELKDMDFQEEPADEKKRLRRKKKQEEEANKRKERKANEKRLKSEVQRPPEYLLQLKIKDLAKDWSSENHRAPMIILSTKDASADDFLFYGQTERVKGETNPAFYKTFSFPKTSDESDLDVELKFAVYDAETDEFKKSQATFLGDGYIKLREIVSNEGPTEVKLTAKRLDKSALVSPLASPKMKGEEIKVEPPPSGILIVQWKERVSEGALSEFRLKFSAHHLPLHTSYLLALHIQDFNVIKAGLAGQTEVSDKTVDPVWNSAIKAQHWSRDDRQLRFGVYDAKEFDPLYADKGLIAYYSTTFEKLLAHKKANPGRPPLHLPLSSVEDGPIPLHSDTCLLLKMHELNEEGEAIPEEGDEELPHAKAEGPAEFFLLSLGARNLTLPSDAQAANSAVVVGLFNLLSDKKFEFLGHTERLPLSSAIEFDKQFTLFKPLQDGSIHSHAHSIAFNHAQPNSLQHRGSRPHSSLSRAHSARRERPEIAESKEEKSDESANPMEAPAAQAPSHSPHPAPRPTNTFKVQFYIVDGSADDSAPFDAVHSPSFREFQFTLTCQQLQRDFHELPIVELSKENKGEKLQFGVLTLRTVDLGQIYHTQFSFAGRDFLKSESSIRSEPSPMLHVYCTNPLTGKQIFVGATDRVSGNRDPTFSSHLSLPRYSHLDREVRVLAYDAAVDGVQVTEKDLIGETAFSLHQLAACESAAQPLEINLIRNGKSSHQLLQVMNHSAAPVPLNAEHSVSQADPLARNVEYSVNEKESGTAPPAEENHYSGLYFSVHGLHKFDWGHDQFPQLALFKKSSQTGRFHFVDASERVRHDVNPNFPKLFAIETPRQQQLYKLVIIDALPALSSDALQAFAWLNEASLSNEEYEDARALVLQSGSHLGEFTFDAAEALQKCTISGQLRDLAGQPVPRSSLHILANELGSASAFALNCAAVNLPKSAARQRCDPVLFLYARSGQPGASESELGRSQRLINEIHPTWPHSLVTLAFQNIDRELRFAVFDCDAATESAPLTRDFLCEARISLNSLLESASAAADHSVELRLTKDGEPVGDNSVLKVRVSARKTLSLDTSERDRDRDGPASKRAQSRDKSRPNSSRNLKSPKSGARSPPKSTRNLAGPSPRAAPPKSPANKAASAAPLSPAKKSAKPTPPPSSRRAQPANAAESPRPQQQQQAQPQITVTAAEEKAEAPSVPEDAKQEIENAPAPDPAALSEVESALGESAAEPAKPSAEAANPQPSVSVEDSLASGDAAESTYVPDSPSRRSATAETQEEQQLPEPNEVN